jgi:hypothetical protein
MAYQKKYTGSFYDRHNDQWRISIYLDGYGGDSQEIILANPPCVVNWTGSDFKYEPIIRSHAEIKIISETLGAYREFLVADESDYVIEIEKNEGSGYFRWWVGFLMPDIYSERYTTPPYTITIKASDGLSRLMGEYYVSTGNDRRSNFYTGVDTLGNIMAKCLLGLRIDLGQITDSTCDTTTGSPTISMDDASELSVGMGVTGDGIPAGATILSVDYDSNQFTLTANATATNTNVTLTFDKDYSVNRILEGLNTYEAGHNSADSGGRLSPLRQTTVDQGAFVTYDNDDKVAISKYEILENIAKVFGARLFLAYDYDQELLAWHLYTVNDYDGTSINRGLYEIANVAATTLYREVNQHSATLTETISTDNANYDSKIIYVNNNHEVTFHPAVKEIITEWKPKNQRDSKYNNLIPNGEFEYHISSNITDWNSTTSLKTWTVNTGTYVRQVIPAPLVQNTDPFFRNRYGVELETDGMYIRNTAGEVFQGFSGSNVLWVNVRGWYSVVTFNGNALFDITDRPRARIDIRIIEDPNGTPVTHYVYRNTSGGFSTRTTTAPTGNEIIYLYFTNAIFDYISTNDDDLGYIPNAVQEIAIPVTMPTFTTGEYGNLEVDLYQTDRSGNVGVSERQIDDTGIPPNLITEDVKVTFEYCRANLSTANGQFGDTQIIYIGDDSNIRTSAQPIKISTIIGDAVDGEGFNVGSLRLESDGSPTDDWTWNSIVPSTADENLTIHEVLAQIVSKNYRLPHLRLAGEFNGASLILPQKHFQLLDNESTLDMVLMDYKYNLQEDIGKCLFVENVTSEADTTITPIITEGIPSVGTPSGGNLGNPVGTVTPILTDG